MMYIVEHIQLILETPIVVSRYILNDNELAIFRQNIEKIDGVKFSKKFPYSYNLLNEQVYIYEL